MEAVALRERLRAEALAMGFDVFGVAPVHADVRADYFRQWIADGMHGDMDWLAKNPDRRTDATRVLPEARSIIVVGLNYYQPHPPAAYRIAKYALGADYHDVMLRRLKKLCGVMRTLGGDQKPYVDTGPVLEKPLAAEAGLGWQGKSTILLQRGFGTWLFLGVILTTLELEPSQKEADRLKQQGRFTAERPILAPPRRHAQRPSGRCGQARHGPPASHRRFPYCRSP